MVLTKRRMFFKPAGAARFFTAIALLFLAAPAIGQTFTNGQYCTFTQGGWGAVPHGNNPAMLLSTNFLTPYPSGQVAIGDNYKMTFEGAPAIQNYLPAGGKPKALTMNYLNPTSTSSGVFGGQVLALQLNVDFSDAGVTPTGFGDLQLVGTPFGAQTVRDLLLVANQMLGGDFTTFDTSLNDLVSLLNQGFDNCYPSGWVQDHLAPSTSCPIGQFEC